MTWRIHDVSMPVHHSMPVYKDKADKRPEFETKADFAESGLRESRAHLDAHTGTHVDAALHMVPGADSIDLLPLEHVVRPARVVDLSYVTGAIQVSDVEALNVQVDEFLLFKTANSKEDIFNPEFVYLGEAAAKWLAEAKVAGVGIDGLGIERSQPGHPTHKALFSSGAVILEGLRLHHIQPGTYFMVAAPLKWMGIEAAPARVVLLEGIGILS
jgi:arylformamidase